MPETGDAVSTVSRDWLQSQLRSAAPNIVVLDCRPTSEFAAGHIRLAVNLSIPSIMLRRLASGKISLCSTIKSRDLQQRIERAYGDSVFVLCTAGQPDGANSSPGSGTEIVSVLHRRLKQDGCRVFLLEDGFASFRDAFPEWCEDDCSSTGAQPDDGRPTAGNGSTGCGSANNGASNPATEQLMGLRSLRISNPHSSSTCNAGRPSDGDRPADGAQPGQPAGDASSSSSGSSGSSEAHQQQPDVPVEIVAGLFLGNATHSRDVRALQLHNIRYVLNVTPDLPNAFAGSPDGIEYLQIPINDHWSQDLAEHFPAAIKFIEDGRNSGCSVLVHCLAGVSRSVTVTLAYLMHARNLSLNDAFSLVRRRKPDVAPNFHFMEQLHTFEQQLLRAQPVRTPLSAVSCVSALSSTPSGSDSSSSTSASCYMTPDCGSSAAGTPGLNAMRTFGAGGSLSRAHKYSCGCVEVECKCLMVGAVAAVAAVPQRLAAAEAAGDAAAADQRPVGVSPDSGIEFDRWTPGAARTPK